VDQTTPNVEGRVHGAINDASNALSISSYVAWFLNKSASKTAGGQKSRPYFALLHPRKNNGEEWAKCLSYSFKFSQRPKISYTFGA